MEIVIYYLTKLLLKIKFNLVLFLLFILMNLQEYNNIEYQLEKEISKIGYSQKQSNWNYIKKDFLLLALKFRHIMKNEKNIPEDSPIWTMWYQGIENAPPIVQSCIKSIIINRGKHHVIIIDKYNLKKYIKLPSYIIEKHNNHTFTTTHFSDIVRMGLLFKYGGYWIDSTYLITTPITKINYTFYSLKKYKFCNHTFITCQWAGNFLATTKNSFISTYGYSTLLLYWKKYNSLINYFLLDYIIYIAYNNIIEFKHIIEKLPKQKCKIPLVKVLNSEYNKSYFNCHFNKLSYKKHWILFKNKTETNYGYLIQKYKLNIKKQLRF